MLSTSSSRFLTLGALKTLPRKMLTYWVREKRPQGAPDFTYGRGVYKALRNVNVGRNEWHECAQDRFAWRNVLNRAT